MAWAVFTDGPELPFITVISAAAQPTQCRHLLAGVDWRILGALVWQQPRAS
jgi:hypothetical protein